MPHVMRKPGALHGWGLALFLAAAHAANDAMTAIVGVLLPSLQARFDVGPAVLGMLVAALWVSSSLAQPLFGALGERLSLRGVSALGAGLAAASLALLGVAPSLVAALALIVIGGVGSAALHPAAAAIAAASGGRRSLAVGLFTAGGMLGFALGPVLILALVATGGVEATPWLMLPGLALATLFLVVAPQWEPHARSGRGLLPSPRLLAGPIGGLVLSSALVMLAFLAMTSALPLWLVSERGFAPDASAIGWSVAAFALGAAAGSLAGGHYAERLPRARFAALSLTLAAAALVAIPALNPASAAFYATAAVAGALLYASNPLMILAAQERAPETPAAAAGMILGVASALAGALHAGAGYLQEIWGVAAGMRVAFLLLLPAAGLATIFLAQRTPASGSRSMRPERTLPSRTLGGAL